MTPPSCRRANSCMSSSRRWPRYLLSRRRSLIIAHLRFAEQLPEPKVGAADWEKLSHPCSPTGVTPWPRCVKKLPTRAAVLLAEYRHRPRPAAGGGADLHREAGHHEAVGRQRFEIVQLLDLAVAAMAAGLVPFPDDRGVAALLIARGGVHERRVPAPPVGADHAHAALGEPHGGLV